ncbi:MAG: hypothetical protein A2836_00945 [Candidatus Taylorbacteria bacterium RIFCSPHIGHO2_01_FULL_45_63]|uniref:HEAT repeat domain-containing protein n=1 Tax=Candidatus Taylorbacteria bacterium RIFCSPHIGHO2_02_FULL_45_35 TaxID=1802311 RepID=A0A1G2MX76_9BACT|nr:MAG: hypothetical protein A2836_00945 [Candidatus Taylorbacteria bacterium RIFCSPHIGHO2_01_FULL_45_63]OHA27652.1 MAG: hypothetical protein A3D56_04180 [Candidatus Taylorbacteria bacterium RIFCSPHIGHO2_02_FULL_45_35]OHA34143.1 MAG: hypothetical protein A3A22_01630 [Candidatus Taylorbacteria bacterium RIFCSPLOWO2_01_FULL_45_34b]
MSRLNLDITLSHKKIDFPKNSVKVFKDMKTKAQKTTVAFEELLEAAREESWQFVDENISESYLTEKYIRWALTEGLFDADPNIRDLAATILNMSDTPLNPPDIKTLEAVLEDDPYHIVRFRVAIALYKRKRQTPLVLRVMEQAKSDPDVGELVRRYFI